MINKLADSFLSSIEEIEKVLSEEQFIRYSFVKKGFAYFVQFKRKSTIVEFIIGPPEFQIEMIIFTEKGRFEFKDLLQIKEISDWISKNRYHQSGERNILKEILWFVDLLKISLMVIE